MSPFRYDPKKQKLALLEAIRAERLCKGEEAENVSDSQGLKSGDGSIEYLPLERIHPIQPVTPKKKE